MKKNKEDYYNCNNSRKGRDNQNWKRRKKNKKDQNNNGEKKKRRERGKNKK